MSHDILKERDIHVTFPDYKDTWLPTRGVTVRILMLTDDDGSYSVEHRFGLTELVKALESTPGVFATFQVTKAHRGTATEFFDMPAEADIQAFRFDNPSHFNPEEYDEIWLVGIKEQVSGEGLSQAELRVVAQFMDRGGGVFATGDHQDLGGALSGQIPRVRSMRKWTYDYSHGYEEYDPNSAEGPPVYGSYRHDTLMAGHNSVYTFDDQSDDIPARIYPKIYGPQNKYFSMRYPHPVLCGPGGIIDVLPDHMHEGVCIIPRDFSQSYTFDGYTTTEYPTGSLGQVSPDVIAEGEVFAHVTDNSDAGGEIDVASRAGRFGVIGAYDGHAVEVGRVVVDSTFHHFVNINVIASGANSPELEKQIGFQFSSAGQKAYDQIRAYWRNIAIWLARPNQQVAMFNRTFWAARWDSQLRMVIPSMTYRKELTWAEVLQYGNSVRATMGRFTSACTSYSWPFAWEHPLAKYSWWLKKTLPDPPPWERTQIFINPEEYIIGMYGSIMMELVRATPERDPRFRDELDERMPAIVRAGMAAAASIALPHYERRLAETRKLLTEIRAAGRRGNR